MGGISPTQGVTDDPVILTTTDTPTGVSQDRVIGPGRVLGLGTVSIEGTMVLLGRKKVPDSRWTEETGYPTVGSRT